MISFDMGKYAEYLSDESGLTGKAESISFPENLQQLQSELIQLDKEKKKICFQGSRTGICAGAVPESGHIMNLSRLNRIEGLRLNGAGNFILKVQPGLRLDELQLKLKSKSFDTSKWDGESLAALEKFKSGGAYIFRPNPTESSASLGGMFNCNSKGLNSLAYGCCSDYVEEIDFCLAAGEIWNIKRGEYVFGEKGCLLPNGKILPACSGAASAGNILRAEPGTDLIDFIAGSEGMLGAAAGLGLRLSREKNFRWGIVLFTDDFSSARQLCREISDILYGESVLSGLEIYDAQALSLIDSLRGRLSSLTKLPEFPAGAGGAAYIEIEGDEEADIEQRLLTVMEIFLRLGGCDEKSWAGSCEKDIELFRNMRHAVPEAAGLLKTGGSRQRFSFDAQLTRENRDEMLRLYEDSASEKGIKTAVFGHYGDSRIHVELLPQDEEQEAAADRLMKEWAERLIQAGGRAAGENGIGKRKKYLNAFSDRAYLEAAMSAKKIFDPDMRLNPGNFFI